MRTRRTAIMLSLLLALGAAACDAEDAGIEEGVEDVEGGVQGDVEADD